MAISGITTGPGNILQVLNAARSHHQKMAPAAQDRDHDGDTDKAGVADKDTASGRGRLLNTHA